MTGRAFGGVLPVLKPPGPTSHDIVDRVRRLSGGARVGHLGTLDPAACGVLVLLVGWATPLADYLDRGTKMYRVRVQFGVESATGDAEGPVRAVSPPNCALAEAASATLASLVGEQNLMPPAYSAIKQGGKVAYRSARGGSPLALSPRRMTFHHLTLVQFEEGEYPVAVVDAEVSRGTYLRSLAVAWGQRLGVPAYVESLLRTRVGPWRLTDASTVEEVTEAAGRSALADLLLPVDSALSYLPAWQGAVPMGGKAPPHLDGPVRVMDPQGKLIAVARADEGMWRRTVRVGDQ